MKKFMGYLATVVLLICSYVGIAAAAVQTPWQTGHGGWLMVNQNWPNYNTGYEFTPQVNGTVVKLGGIFNGTKVVRLYDEQGTILAQAYATDSNQWGYADITPVAVEAGKKYTVAVYTGWGGTSMYYGMGFPMFPIQVGDVVIERAVFGMGYARPTYELWGQMWGQPDIGFVPEGEVQPIECPVGMFCAT